MTEEIIKSALWWISVIEIPVLAGIFSLLMGLMKDASRFQLDVARTYAASNDVRELERRLTAHLLRIEAKLDQTALKTEQLSARDHRGVRGVSK